jgi:1-hydroxycarotenoid 3,4-desaturase
MPSRNAVIIGAGIGGLAAAIDLAVQGIDVTLIERADGPGGKLRGVYVGGQRLDAGPTVLTMRSVFDELFDHAGASLDEYVRLLPLAILARHAWSEDERLDLFANPQQSANAIGDFAGAAEAKRFLEFCTRSREIFKTLDAIFMRTQRPSPLSLAIAAAPHGLDKLWNISPFTTMWQALGRYFHDPRLRQLFGRYATYCGSSPFASPATLMLVAHAEQMGVWTIEGGMFRLAEAMAKLATARGVSILYNTDVTEVTVAQGRASGVRLADDEHIVADAVICNADIAALSSGLLGSKAKTATPKTRPESRSLSAVTWVLRATAQGFPLHRHNVFFSGDYPTEFNDIAGRQRLPTDPTVYVCAQDRGDDGRALTGPERLLFLINAPPTGDRDSFDISEIEKCSETTFRKLRSCGLHLSPKEVKVTTPADFNRMYPGTGGALYGRASHGWMASFQRPAARSKLPGLYLAGGSTHPGPGMPMAAISGRLAAQCVIADLTSGGPSHATATRGGTSTR